VPCEFFLEVDRSSETLDTLVVRCLCYRSFYHAGGLAHWHGAPRDDFDRFPFRVLVVTANAERRNNLAARLASSSPPILGQVWLAVAEQVGADPLGPIWISPGDYRNALAGTEFDLNDDWSVGGYRRRSARERLVDERVRYRRLLD
jgi:hypothetical protein